MGTRPSLRRGDIYARFGWGVQLRFLGGGFEEVGNVLLDICFLLLRFFSRCFVVGKYFAAPAVLAEESAFVLVTPYGGSIVSHGERCELLRAK